ncbi:MAG: peptide chain release factor N(5)-glutamine methyltransferase [Eubacteriales bacterium]|nr:peptide chain release factor N(5)-glutamine methyltransferase [Eubacteriales bacterium]
MTYNYLINEASSILKKYGIENYKYDAQQLLLELEDLDMASFICLCEKNLEDFLSDEEINNIIENYQELISLRCERVPLQYIVGKTYFCGLEFLVSRDVLIPRIDTETLVEKFIEDNTNVNIDILDMCTGSGCIAIALSKLGNYRRIIGVDISSKALNIASQNAQNIIEDNSNDDELNKEVLFVQSDLYDNFKILEEKIGISKFDYITCNPPYIKSKDINTLQDEVKKYEPKIALDGDIDGLKFYKKLAKDSKNFLKKNGKIYLEIGYDQAKDVISIFEKENYIFVELVKDMEKRDRVIIMEKND